MGQPAALRPEAPPETLPDDLPGLPGPTEGISDPREARGAAVIVFPQPLI
ncbi:MAG: hypothetical protein OXF57_12540 [Rhodospirillaceae bacterium]|nr:hypothetical protein [Rhodospirillaceae bacterium]